MINISPDKHKRPVRMCIMTTVPITLVFFYKGLLDFFVDKGFEVTVITSPDEELIKKLSTRVKYIFIPMCRGISPLRDLQAFVHLAGILKNGEFDIIQYCTPKAAFLGSIAAWLCRVPVRLYLMWGVYYTSQSGLLRSVMKSAEKVICFFSTNVSPDSYGNYNFAISEGLCPAEKISVVGEGSASGIDLDRFNPDRLKNKGAEIRNGLNIPSNSIVIGFVGRLCRDKGINELVLAFKELVKNNDELYLLLVGPMEDDICKFESVVQDMLLHDRNILRVGYQDKPEEFLAAMDIFVLPSYREGFGSANIEASSMSLPVISTDIPGTQNSVLDGETGLLVPSKSVDKLKDALEVLIGDKELRKRMGIAGSEFAKKFEQKSHWEKILQHRVRLVNQAENEKIEASPPKIHRSLMWNYFIVIAATLTSNILALIREILTAKYFGVSASIDSFVVAFSFISVFTYMFTSGLMQNATIPLFAQYSQDADKGKAFFSNLMSFVFFASGLLILVILGAALYFPGLLSMIAPGFSPEEILNVRIYIEILSVIVFFVILGSVLISMLQFRGAFFTSFSSYIVNNIVIIVFLLAFTEMWGVKSVVIGTAAGGFSGFVVLVWFALRQKIYYSFSPMRFDHKIKNFLAAITPIFLFIFFSQIEMMFEKAFVSSTSSGNIAALNYAYKLALIPVTIFGTGLAIAGFPAFASLIADKNAEASNMISVKITESLRVLIYSLIPLSIFLYVFSVPCIRFFLERGIFSAEASVRTGAALQYYSIGILGQALIIYLCRIFYARRDFWAPLKIGVVIWVVQIFLCWVLVRWVGYTGIAMANALCVYLFSGVMIFVTLRKFISINISSIIIFLAKITVLAIISVILTLSLFERAGIRGKLSVIGDVAIFGFIFLLGSYLLRIPETMIIFSKARGFLKKTGNV